MALGVKAKLMSLRRARPAQYEKLAEKVLGEYPNLKAIAITLRESKIRVA